MALAALILWVLLNCSARRCIYLQSKPDFRGVLRIEGGVEVVVKYVTENPVVHVREILADDRQMTILDFFPCVDLAEYVVLRLHRKLGTLTACTEVEGQVWQRV